MILDDLFEQKPLPAHIKASDLPPGMRSRLTMRDVEQERPRGAYRYRVIPGTPGESPKDFLDLPGAEQYAQSVRGRVQPLEEQVSNPDIQRGMENLDALERNARNDLPVEIQNETGRPEYQIETARDKQWVINHAKEWVDAGRANDLYQYMGNSQGFEFLLRAWQKEDAYRSAQSKRVKFDPDADTTADLLGPRAVGTPRAPRYQDESQHGQKKRTDVIEAPQGAKGRTERMMAQMRARQPQAASDIEALAYELQDAEKRDAQEINKLEQEVNELETDIKSELQKRISTLTRRRGGIQQAAATDTKIDATLDQLAQVNDQQQRDINTLTRAVASMGRQSATTPVSLSVDAGSRPNAQPAASTSNIQVPTTYRSKTTTQPDTATDPYAGAVTGLIGQMQKPASVTPTDGAASMVDQPPKVDQPPAEERPKNLSKGDISQVAGVDPSQWRKKVANIEEQERDLIDRMRGAYQTARATPAAPAGAQDLVDKARNSALGRTIGPAVRRAGQALAQTGIGKKIGSEYGMAKSALGALKGALSGKNAPSPFDIDQSEWHKYGWAEPPEAPATAPSQTTAPAPAPAATTATAPAKPAAAPAASGLIVPTSYSRGRSAQQHAAITTAAQSGPSLELLKKATMSLQGGPALTASELKTVNDYRASQGMQPIPAGWKMGDPINIGGQVITSSNPQYQKIAQSMSKQGIKEQDIAEKKKPQPTNPDLWSRAKSAARSKFDVYPSAYANAWAAKWYKSKGGGWRMGKPKKK
jgi:hypothetical protein